MLKVPKNQAVMKQIAYGRVRRKMEEFCLSVFSTHENSTPKLKRTSFDRKVN